MVIFPKSQYNLSKRKKKQQPRINNKKNENKTTITQNHAIVY